MIYYISDLHFGHANVIKFDGRPFQSVEEMDKTLIDYWNARVTDNDDIYIIGDLCYRSSKYPDWYLRQLKGKKHLVLGNHDGTISKNVNYRKFFVEVDNMLYIKDKFGDTEVGIHLCHYPLVEWNSYFRGSWHIYGHIHNSKNEAYEIMRYKDKALNAGCMINNYMPVLFTELVSNNMIYRNK